MSLRQEDIVELIALLQYDKRERESYREWRDGVTRQLMTLDERVSGLQMEAGARKILVMAASILVAIAGGLATVVIAIKSLMIKHP